MRLQKVLATSVRLLPAVKEDWYDEVLRQR
jgi:hypothetical protein